MRCAPRQARDALTRAMNIIPEGEAFLPAKRHVAAAISHIDDAEYRRERRESTARSLDTIEGRRQAIAAAGLKPWQAWQLTIPQTKKAIDALDQMIKDEMSKIEPAKTPIKPEVIVD